MLILSACAGTDNFQEKIIETEPAKAAFVSAPFSKGVNFSQWFEVIDAERIPYTQYTEHDFENAKSLGADVIRLPVRLNDMTEGAPGFKLQPLLLKLLDMAVDWAEKHELYIIIDNHSIDATPVNIDKVLIPVWEQVAQRYRNRSKYLVYEILNEPHGISDELWGDIQGRAIEAIRKHDQKHWIIAGGADYNSFNKLSAIPEYSDPHLIYTFHFYDPMIFTHQGASWTPPLNYLSGVPFPYNADKMPRTPFKIRGTWAENSLRNYRYEASPSRLLKILDDVVSFSIERNAPVFCGEYGVFIPNSRQEDRVTWYGLITKALDNRNISRAIWDYYGGFGIFNDGIKGDFYTDLNIDLVKALSFNPPPLVERTDTPLQTGFTIFDDFTGKNISSGFWVNNDSVLSFYDSSSADGEYAIRIFNAGRHNYLSFSFIRNKNFSELAAENYILEFKGKAEEPVVFDVRFIMPENKSSIPWRVSYKIDENILPADGRWHTIRIPLINMSEQGAWISLSQKWLYPKGEFSWANIERLEFAAEHKDLKGLTFRLDSIKITR